MNLGDATLTALDELSRATMTDINYSTAITWAGRALASFQLFEQTGELHRFMDAHEFMHEAMEHASLAGDAGLLNAIRGPLVLAEESARQFASQRMACGRIHLSMVTR